MNTQYLNGLPAEWTAIADVFSALGDGTRQTILLLFEPGEAIELKTLVDLLPLSRSAVVHHLKVLEQAGLLVPHRHGRSLAYTLNVACVIHALDEVRGYAEALLPLSPDLSPGLSPGLSSAPAAPASGGVFPATPDCPAQSAGNTARELPNEADRSQTDRSPADLTDLSRAGRSQTGLCQTDGGKADASGTKLPERHLAGSTLPGDNASGKNASGNHVSPQNLPGNNLPQKKLPERHLADDTPRQESGQESGQEANAPGSKAPGQNASGKSWSPARDHSGRDSS